MQEAYCYRNEPQGMGRKGKEAGEKCLKLFSRLESTVQISYSD